MKSDNTSGNEKDLTGGITQKSQFHQKLLCDYGLIECEQTPITDKLKEENIVIKLSSYDIVENGILSKGHVSYLITTYPLKYEVHRRYSDFECLSHYFSSKYINTVIPPLPKKNYRDRLNDDFIKKRMRKLEKFLNSIITNPLLFYDPIFLDFINLEEKDWIKKQTYYYKQYETPCELKKLYSLDGRIHYNIPDNEKEFSNIKDHLESNERLINTLLSLYKNLFEHMNEMVLQINALKCGNN